MNWQTIIVIATGFGVLWVLHKIGQALTKLLEAVAAIAVVFLTLWLAREVHVEGGSLAGPALADDAHGRGRWRPGCTGSAGSPSPSLS